VGVGANVGIEEGVEGGEEGTEVDGVVGDDVGLGSGEDLGVGKVTGEGASVGVDDGVVWGVGVIGGGGLHVTTRPVAKSESGMTMNLWTFLLVLIDQCCSICPSMSSLASSLYNLNRSMVKVHNLLGMCQ
jgi:hypothetical protein